MYFLIVLIEPVIVGVMMFFVSGYFASMYSGSSDLALVIALVTAVCIYILSLFLAAKRIALLFAIGSLFKSDTASDTSSDEDVYAKAEDEIETNNYNKNLWSKAFVIANGDEKLRKVEYMKLRAKEVEDPA